MSNVISEGFTRLLPATLQIPGVSRTYVRALENASEDLPMVVPTIGDISR
jgi:hypothetical protein